MGSIEEASHAIGLSEFFIGAIVVAIVGNAAEHWVAVLVAYKNKMSLAVNIAIGSSAQVALFVTPVLVLVSFVLGPHPMALVFNGFELPPSRSPRSSPTRSPRRESPPGTKAYSCCWSTRCWCSPSGSRSARSWGFLPAMPEEVPNCP